MVRISIGREAPWEARRKRARRISATLEFAVVVVGVALRAWAERTASEPPRRSHARRDRRAAQGTGRAAASPARLPASHWKDILLRTWREFQQDQIPAVAGSVAYSVVVAIFPALAAFVSLYGLFSDVGEVRRQFGVLSGIVPAAALEMVGSEMMRIAGNRHANLGPFLAGIAVSLWTSNAGMKAMMRGLNIAYEERETRNFLRLNLESLALTLAGVVVLLLASAAVVVAPLVLQTLNVDVRVSGFALLRWPALFVMVVLGLAVLYRFGPDHAHPRWRWVTPGSLTATVVWILGSLAFSWFVSHFGRYNATYGSLGALFGFLTWIWLTAVIVLAGAELDCEVERWTGQIAPGPAQSPMRASSTPRKRSSP